MEDLTVLLRDLTLRENDFLITADANSMYTEIPTGPALMEIERYLQANRARFPTIPVDALIPALHIVMWNNIFRFVGRYFKQKSGTTMGTPPAPPYATLFFAIHKATLYRDFPELIFSQQSHQLHGPFIAG